MSIWGLLAMLTMGFPGVSVDEPSVHAPVEQEVRIENEQNYLVVEQIEGGMARLESEAGMIWVPLGALPEFARQEVGMARCTFGRGTEAGSRAGADRSSGGDERDVLKAWRRNANPPRPCGSGGQGGGAARIGLGPIATRAGVLAAGR